MASEEEGGPSRGGDGSCRASSSSRQDEAQPLGHQSAAADASSPQINYPQNQRYESFSYRDQVKSRKTVYPIPRITTNGNSNNIAM